MLFQLLSLLTIPIMVPQPLCNNQIVEIVDSDNLIVKIVGDNENEIETALNSREYVTEIVEINGQNLLLKIKKLPSWKNFLLAILVLVALLSITFFGTIPCIVVFVA